jgi:DNA-binding transcriptional MerR regulator
MLIGELAAQADVTAKTIRYYESIGLLPQPRRTDAGYRVYDEEDVERLGFIRRAVELDLPLGDIGEILALRDRTQRPCDYVVRVARERLADLEERIARMRHARDELRELLARADDLPDGDDCYCGLIEHTVRT